MSKYFISIVIFLTVARVHGLICRQGTVIQKVFSNTEVKECSQNFTNPVCLSVKGISAGISVEYFSCYEKRNCTAVTCREIIDSFENGDAVNFFAMLSNNPCLSNKCCDVDNCNNKAYDSIDSTALIGSEEHNTINTTVAPFSVTNGTTVTVAPTNTIPTTANLNTTDFFANEAQISNATQISTEANATTTDEMSSATGTTAMNVTTPVISFNVTTPETNPTLSEAMVVLTATSSPTTGVTDSDITATTSAAPNVRNTPLLIAATNVFILLPHCYI